MISHVFLEVLKLIFMLTEEEDQLAWYDYLQ